MVPSHDLNVVKTHVCVSSDVHITGATDLYNPNSLYDLSDELVIPVVFS